MGSTTRREFLKIGAVGAASAALGWPRSLLAADTERKPNIIVILSDDHGYAQLGCYGCKDIPTPNIDSIAANGVRFTDGYVTCPVCSPTRSALMTGRYQQRFGHEFNPAPVGKAAPDFGVPRDEPTIAERLKKVGYATGLVGKWHIGFADPLMPLQRGFDEFFGFKGAEHSYLDPKALPMNPILRGNNPIEEPEYLTDAFSREAVAFVRKHAKHPFFLYLAFNAVHSPLEATDKYLKRFEHIQDKKRRTYAAMLSAMDDAVGAVLEQLRKHNLEDNTLIFFLSDNGSPNYGPGYNAPLKGGKGDVWEGGVRVPFMVQWKSKLPKGKVYDRPVSSLDIHATALAAAGVTPPVEAGPAKRLDGVDLTPYLTGRDCSRPHDALFWRMGKLRAVRCRNYKLVWHNSDIPTLYDLSSDIGESTDLSARMPATVKSLTALYERWNSEMIDPKWPVFISPKKLKEMQKQKEAGGEDGH